MLTLCVNVMYAHHVYAHTPISHVHTMHAHTRGCGYIMHTMYAHVYTHVIVRGCIRVMCACLSIVYMHMHMRRSSQGIPGPTREWVCTGRRKPGLQQEAEKAPLCGRGMLPQ